MSAELKVGLAQINNSFSGASYLPYATGLLQAYAERHLSDPDRFAFLPHLYKRMPVDDAVAHLRNADIVGFSLYVWNQNLSLAIAKRLKELRPEIVVVFGGPQVPDRSEAFLRAHRFVDVAVHGEGEETFTILLERSRGRYWPGVPGTSFIDSDECFHATPKAPRLRDLSLIPSPFLCGVFDDLMANNAEEEWLVLWETNRGCPFQCTFCDWGSATQSKIFRFDMERIEGEINWFSKNRIEFVFCCDANFGILNRDVEIAKLVKRNKERFGYPRALSVQNTKNATERAYETQRILTEAGLNKGVTLSMQSTDLSTLENIRRENISLETYEELQRRFTRDNVATYSDLILALPGESYSSFADGVSMLIENGQHNRIQFNNLSILPNAEMGDPEYQRQFGMQLVDTRILNIHGKAVEFDSDVAETQQLVVATNSMPPEDWRRSRAFSWMTALLHFDKLMQIPLVILHEVIGATYRQSIEAFLDADPERFPLLSEIATFFLSRAAEIQVGGAEYVRAPQWLDIWWPDDEYVFIELSASGRLESFYREGLALLECMAIERRAANHLEPIGDAIRLNRALLKQPFQQSDVEIVCRYNVLDVYQGVLLGRPKALVNQRVAYRIERSREGWNDWQTWCREVVWFGNKMGAYLYGGIALEKYYAGLH